MNENDIKEAEMMSKIHNLKERINELKKMHLEDAKYRETVEGLVEKDIINREGEEFIKFLDFFNSYFRWSFQIFITSSFRFL